MKSKLILCLALLLGALALCGTGLWLLLSPPQYAATARVKIERDEAALGEDSYDPYFIETEFEMMQSQLVLSNVIADLNLEETWGKKHFHGEPLKTAQCYAILRDHLRFMSVRNTRFVDITYFSDDPKEAADIANAIAESYQKYRLESLRTQTLLGIEALQQQFQDEEKHISMLQTNVEQLRRKYGIQSDASTDHPSEQQPYWKAKNELDRLRELQKLLASKIEAIKLDEKMPKDNRVQIIDQAVPPQFPASPDRALGAALLVVGLFPLLGGILLLKSKP